MVSKIEFTEACISVGTSISMSAVILVGFYVGLLLRYLAQEHRCDRFGMQVVNDGQHLPNSTTSTKGSTLQTADRGVAANTHGDADWFKAEQIE